MTRAQRLLSLVATLIVVTAIVPGAAGAAAEAPDDACTFPVEVEDATGTTVTIGSEPQRIVTLGPAAAQTLVELGVGDRIVGATKYASYLEGSSDWKNVSGPGRTYASVEKVVALEPDLVIAANITSPGTIEKLREAGITVYEFRKASSLSFVYEKVKLTGELVGAYPAAVREVAEMKYWVTVAQEAAEGKSAPKALYTFYGYTAGENTYIDDIIGAAGGENLAATAGIDGYKPINNEVVANLTVEWLLLNGGSPRIPSSEAYQNTIAVQRNQTIVLNENYISQPAPRIVEPIKTLASTWYPEAWSEAKASVDQPDVENPCDAEGPTTTTTTTTSGDGTTTTTATTAGTTTTDDGGSARIPGFTTAVALVAVLAGVALLARRRRP